MIPAALAILTVLGFTVAALLAFTWAAQSGQFHDADAGARAVFDPDEPEGTTTDAFPGEHGRVANRSDRS